MNQGEFASMEGMNKSKFQAHQLYPYDDQFSKVTGNVTVQCHTFTDEVIRKSDKKPTSKRLYLMIKKEGIP